MVNLTVQIKNRSMEIEDVYMTQAKYLRGVANGMSNIMGTKITWKFRKVNDQPVHQFTIESQGEVTVLFFEAKGNNFEERMELVKILINVSAQYLQGMEEYWDSVKEFLEEGRDDELLSDFVKKEEDIEKIFSEISGGDQT